MKILLVGEYSRLHNSLKEGLQKLGHEVVLLGFNDGFKNYPVDFQLVKKWDSGLLKKMKIGVLKLTGFDFSSFLIYKQFWKNRNQFKDFDIVQLINENSFFCNYHFEKKILDFLFQNNKKVFLLSAGDDFMYVDYNFKHPENPSIVQPYLKGKIKDKNFINVLKYRTKEFEKLHHYIYKNIKGVIATDIDYQIPLENHPKYLGLIPAPINLEKFPKNEMKIGSKIEIFHGINRESYFKKGNNYFETALKIIAKKYPEKVSISIVENVPYSKYIQLYNKAHIVLDQLYGHDQGSNALEAMTKGKVVFTNASSIFEKHYQLSEKVAINALPNIDYLVEKLTYLIENPEEILAIGKRARTFIEEVHNAEKIANQYVEVWEKN
ncbi:glycosyltransferase [Flavobacterium capsici]|uniref:Glycosyltransferase n=1 Tax=Flavobacterium capsici TaxID=3075618 RepID=A0AA96J576_9FLAO|nr:MULTISPECIES: glycosyltransferase [unclassified Flavobacterium]WNM18751.1 glycosyltransferase [Flavobacterium sp. PMR2A8]WNM22802.1 glycosyltransferase [Flavobacterium sp. PMTSA4]